MYQYQVGDYVIKVNVGLCRVGDIMPLDGMGSKEKKLYYLLVPFSDDDMKIYVPVDQDSCHIRKVASADEAWEIIKKIPLIEEMQIDNEKQREQRYKDMVRSCDPEKWISMLKTIYLRKQTRSAMGKKNTAIDEHYFKLAEELLYSELAFAVGKEKSEMRQLIAEMAKKEAEI